MAKKDQRKILFDAAENLLSAIYVLSDNKSKMDKEELALNEEITEFAGALVGRAFFNSFSDKKQVDLLLNSMQTTEWLLMSSFETTPYLSDEIKAQIPEFERIADSLYSPVDSNRFKKDLHASMDNRTSFRCCLFALHKSIYESGRLGDNKTYLDFCEHCPARDIGETDFPTFLDRFGSRFACLQFAHGVDSLSSYPGVPQSKVDSLRRIADNFREFANIDKDSVDNYEDVVRQMSQFYACAKVESAALVRREILPAPDVAQSLGLSLDDVVALTEHKGVKLHVDVVAD